MPGPDGPFALAVVGAAGSGKSTVAVELARRCRAVYLDKDRLAGPLVDAALAALGQSLEERESNRLYRERLMPAEYAALFSVAGDNLRLGLPVVIDAPFGGYLHQPDFFETAAQKASWPELSRFVIRVFASEDETKRRLAARGLRRDRAKLESWSGFWREWGQTHVSWNGVQVLDLDNEVSADVDGAIRRIS